MATFSSENSDDEKGVAVPMPLEMAEIGNELDQDEFDAPAVNGGKWCERQKFYDV